MRTGIAEWSWAERTAPGQAESGDSHLVRPIDDGVLIAVMDGLGHGPEAARASRAAVSALSEFPPSASLSRMMGACHAALECTRGATVSLARFDARNAALAWLAVGNISGLLVRRTPVAGRRDESLLLSPGLVGEQLPRLRESSLALARGDVLVLMTDGVDPHVGERLDTRRSPSEVAEDIMRHGARSHDDALVVVARYMG
ncbi:MAG: SpoIIE family protein phosphatase [Halofilum sp. (in: g-proteobacteria)]